MKSKLRIAEILLTVASVSGAVGVVPVPDHNAVTEEAARHGWSGASDVPADVPQFAIVGAPPAYSSAGERVVLWTYSQAINGGQHFPAMRQEIGDCVSFGAAQGMNYTQAAALCRDISYRRFRPSYPPYIYGTSRVLIGKGQLGNSDGSVGIWAVKGLEKYGVLPADEPGVPGYSGSIAKEWGRRGPPQQWIDVADDFPLKAYAQVSSYEQARDAIANGYAVTVASNQGFANGREVEASGVLWGVASGSWMHQMVFIGVDDNLQAPDGSKGGLYCLNSWGASAHRAPIAGEPPGGFWVSAKVATRMLRQDDSWALSGFDGFPYTAERLDLDVFEMNVEIPEQDAPLVSASEEIGVPAEGSGTTSVAAGAGAWYARRRRRQILKLLVA